ncbi:hypothetical protein [Stenotrophomonas terrae]|uniref:hypothetical protein n=1 Tax=Stenotrophomonas terrae TaxID=405446 RepID=UPI00070DFE9B|nr:hypothetical protein [Stenotrophomonas terrae]
MKLSVLLGVALVSTSALAHAGEGTVQFSGRITSPGCATALEVEAQRLRLDDCPRATQGAAISVKTLDTGSTVPVGPATDLQAATTLMAPLPQAQQRLFSTQYRLAAQSMSNSGYLVQITYL